MGMWYLYTFLKWTLLYLFSVYYDRCAKRWQPSPKNSKSIDSFFSLSSANKQRDDADVVIATEQMEDFEGFDDVILDN